MYPTDGIAENDVIDYYATVADHMLPLVRDRLMTLKQPAKWDRRGTILQQGHPQVLPGLRRADDRAQAWG